MLHMSIGASRTRDLLIIHRLGVRALDEYVLALQRNELVTGG